MAERRGMFEAIHGEIRATRTEARAVALIRISLDAIPGSVVVVPMAPERKRRYAALAVRDGIVADESADLRELLMHPEDWAALLKEADSLMALSRPSKADEPYRVFGIPVERRTIPRRGRGTVGGG